MKAAADGGDDGSLNTGGENTMQNAAKHDSLAALDAKNRGQGAYMVSQGTSALPNTGQILAVSPAPKHNAIATDTTPSRETKSAEAEYNDQFNKVANEYVPFLPVAMSADEKVAHVQALMSLPPVQRVPYIKGLTAR